MQGLSPKEAQRLLLSVGSHRRHRPITPVEVALSFRRMMEAGASLKEIAEFVHFDGPSMVSRFRAVLRLAPELQHLIDWGQSGGSISFTVASELSKLSTDDQRAACQAALTHSFTTTETKQLIQLRRRSGRRIEACLQSMLKQRPQVEVRHVLIGAITNPSILDQLPKLTQPERDKLLTTTLSQVLPKAQLLSIRLGTTAFTLVGDDTFNTELQRRGGDIERDINEVLGKATNTYA